MSDEDIISLARIESRIIVTTDKDFGELAFKAGLKHTGILLLRIGHLAGSEQTAILKFIVDNYEAELSGNFCIYKNRKFRVKKGVG